MSFHGLKIKKTLLLSEPLADLLQRVAKASRKSESSIVEESLAEKLIDPVKIIKEQKRKLAMEMNDLDQKIIELEDHKARHKIVENVKKSVVKQ